MGDASICWELNEPVGLWLLKASDANDHRTELRELMRENLGGAPFVEIHLATPRLLCIAGESLNHDEVVEASSRRCTKLLRFRRYGDSYIILLESVHAGDSVETALSFAVCPRQAGSKVRRSA